MITRLLGSLFVLSRKVADRCIRDYYQSRFAQAGRRISIGHNFWVHSPEHIRLGEDVAIAHNVTLRALTAYPWVEPPQTFEPSIRLGNRVFLNCYTEISAASSIELEDDVMIAPGCFITDNSHSFRDAEKTIRSQPVEVIGPVKIGTGSWVGAHTVVLGNVTIGKHAIIAAHSIVNKDIPDYCIAAGAPARVIKKFNADSGEWERVE
jgi:acetyltransferase-like isoleucine patch superfamily enzyme